MVIGGCRDWPLAQSGQLVTALFETATTTPPEDVTLGDRLETGDGGHRRPDILLHDTTTSISIEVEFYDENYRKTAETARLIEEAYDEQEWQHTLLLPKKQMSRLQRVVDPPVETAE